MDSGKVEALQTWQAPARTKDVQRFLGFANYYRPFIPHFSTLAAPLTRLLQKGAKFQWGREEQQAFLSLKQTFMKEPVLKYPDPRRPFVVEADASDVAVGAILLQRRQDGGPLFPCAYFSKKLNPAERNYTIWEKELLAIKSAFETWRHHLEGARHQIEVKTDHKNLQFLQTARKLNQRQIRWSLFFARFNFRVTYVPRGYNKRADALSRKPEYVQSPDPLPLRTILPVHSLAAVQDPVDLRRRIADAQRQDAFALQRRQEVGPDSPWTFADNLLRYRDLLYVPAGPLRGLILHQCHDNPAAGHFGLFKTMNLVSRTFWWPKLRHDVQSYVQSCVRCRQAKNVPGAPAGLLRPLPTPQRPWGVISMDFLTCLPVSAGSTAVLVVVDTLTKMCHFIPCRRIPTAKATAQLFIQHVFRLHGLPDAIVSDRGTQFTAQFWTELMAALQVRVCLASTQHPQTDGGTEKVIGILQQYLRCFIHDQQDQWSKYLSVAEFAFNNSQHSSTRSTPFFANYGYHPRFFPLTLLDSPVPVAEDYLSELQAVQNLVKQHLNKAKADYKRFADRSRRDVPPLAAGDRVWLSTKHLFPGHTCRKLDQRYLGPFPVETVINPVTYRINLPRSFRVHPVFHRSLLVPVSPDSPLRAPDPDSPAPRASVHLPRLAVSDIQDSRWLDDQFQYLVVYGAGGPDNTVWVDGHEVDAPPLIWDYHARCPDKPHPFRLPREEGPEGGDGVVSQPVGHEVISEGNQPVEQEIISETEETGPAECSHLEIESRQSEGESMGGDSEAEGEQGDISMLDSSDSEIEDLRMGRWEDARFRRKQSRAEKLFGKRQK